MKYPLGTKVIFWHQLGVAKDGPDFNYGYWLQGIVVSHGWDDGEGEVVFQDLEGYTSIKHTPYGKQYRRINDREGIFFPLTKISEILYGSST